MSESDRDRIIKLETQREFQESFNAQVLAQLESIEKEVRLIADWIQNKTGFIAGVIFCCSIIGAAIGAAASLAWGLFHR